MSRPAENRAPLTDRVPAWAPAGLVVLLGAAALDVTGRIGQLGPARFTAYQLLAFVMTAFAGWLVVTRRTAIPRTPVTLPALAFLGTAVLSLAFASERLPAVVQLVSLASSIALAFVALVVVRRPESGSLVVLGVLAAAAVLGVFAVFEWADVFAVQYPVFYTPGYGIRARVTFGDPNILASFLMTALLLAVPLLVVAPMRRVVRIAGWTGAAAALLGLAATFSRGGLGGLFVGLACAVVLLRVSRRAKAIIVAAVLIAVLVAALVVFEPGWIADNVLDLADDGSMMNRVYMAKGALEMWLDHPFGVGIDNYRVVYPQYQDPRAEQGIVYSHTAYVTVLAELGFLGLLAFGWLLWRFFARTAGSAARRALDPTVHALAVGAFAASAGMAAQAFTYSLEGSKFWWFALGLGAAAWRMYAEPESAVT